MIFVVLAMARCSCPFLANKIRPLSASIRTADRAYSREAVISSSVSTALASCGIRITAVRIRTAQKTRLINFLLFNFMPDHSRSIRLTWILCPEPQE